MEFFNSRVIASFKTVCCYCGQYREVVVEEERTNGNSTIVHLFCQECKGLAGTEIPIWRQCEVCGKHWNIRGQTACPSCHCSTLRTIRLATQQAELVEHNFAQDYFCMGQIDEPHKGWWVKFMWMLFGP